jgi:hypothetical protein
MQEGCEVAPDSGQTGKRELKRKSVKGENNNVR